MTDTSQPTPQQLRQALRWSLRQAGEDFDARAQRGLQAWLEADPRHRLALARQQAFWQRVDAAGPAVLAALPGLIEPLPVARRLPRRRRWQSRLLALAAGVALAIGLGPPLLLELRSDLLSGSQPRTARLPDGSSVVMDADTALALAFRDGQRQVQVLQGRAWFDVAPQPAPFVVRAGAGEVEDIGTAFSVALEHGAVIAAVSSGEIEVRTRADMTRRVQAGQQLAFDADGVLSGAPVSLGSDEVAPWRRGEVLLDRVPAYEAIARMARYRQAPVWILRGGRASSPVSALFHTDQPDPAIEAIAGQGGMQLRRLPGGAIVVW